MTELVGARVVVHHGDPGNEYRALRRAAVLTHLPHVGVGVLRGPGARALARRLLPGADGLRTSEACHSLVLDDDGVVLADAFVLADADRVWILADGLATRELVAWLDGHGSDGVELEDRTGRDHVIGLDGPFAWEVLARFDSPGVIGLPPLTFFHTPEGVLCLRASRTGEYGYWLLVPKACLKETVERLHRAGQPLGLRQAGIGTLARAALENFCFWPHAEGRHGLTPLELQLQWRLPPDGEHVAAAALRARRTAGWTSRIVPFHAAEASVGDRVLSGEAPIGRVLRAEPWGHGEGVVGLALLALSHAHPGFTWRTGRGELRTVPAPLVVNRSLHVRPQVHRWQDEADLPTLEALELPAERPDQS